jgi:hypothetical protein
MKIMGF